MKRSPMKQKPSTTVSPAQRAAVKDRVCLICARGPVDPAHLIDKSLVDDMADPRAVIPLCREHHRAFDDGHLSILEYLEPQYRPELAFAVERFGLLRTLQRVTNDHWVPERRAA